MRHLRLMVMSVACLVVMAAGAWAVVDVSFPRAEVTQVDGETRTVQPVTLANEVGSYTLVYDYNVRPDKPGEATSKWWGWSSGFIPIGMTQPSNPNWYWQAFFNWYFDGEDLSKRPAVVRVVRGGGGDGVVEYAWDTPAVKASVYFAMTSGSDKLLMFGKYEPKVAVKESHLTFICYPATFEMPRNRAVTTALGTRKVGETVNVDLAREKWVLYEDTTPGRPGMGSAGLVIGTPEKIAKVSIPVGDYGITTRVDLKPEARDFALGLYDFPSVPDYETTRAYFRRGGDAEAAALGKMAAAGIEQPLPPLTMEAARLASIQAGQKKLYERPSERWTPVKDGAAPWVAAAPGGPVKVALYVPRWRAWETMLLAGSVPLEVQSLYFDGEGALANADYWPYAGTTGIGAIPHGVGMQQAVKMAQDQANEVLVVAGVNGAAIPSLARQEIAKAVGGGKGLLLVGPDRVRAEWPAEMFKAKNADLAATALAGIDTSQTPGFREGDKGRMGALLEAFDYGKGRVVWLRINPTTYGCLIPRNGEMEGQEGVADQAMLVAARALQAAAGRLPAVQMKATASEAGVVTVETTGLPAGAQVLAMVRDDLDVPWAGHLAVKMQGARGTANLPPFPRNRRLFVEVRAVDGQERVIGNALTSLAPLATAAGFKEVTLSPLTGQPAEALTPKLDLAAGGVLTVTAQAERLTGPTRLWGKVYDAFYRVLGEGLVPVGKDGKARLELKLTRPVTVCHWVDLELIGPTKAGDVVDAQPVYASERVRFTVPMAYPYDDFTGLLWSYAGGDPVLRRTDRACYDWGADMMDLCHMGGYDDAGARREYELSSQSGLRVIPYVTRIAGTGNDKHERVPCLHDPEYLQKTEAAITTTSRQAQAYSPAAYTLGDENYMFEGKEVCLRAESVAEYRKWLQGKYGNIAALNAAWGSGYGGFGEVQPMLLEDAAKQQVSFAPWLDHKLFMSETFSNTHDIFRETIRNVDPQAKVGYDGFLGFNWQSGYDFERLGRNLDLNQVYTVNWIQGELMRAFKRPGSLTGKWGNSDADVEAGWHAFPWQCLLDDDNSAWWWTSWGCDYIPFNPDLSQNNFGKWFFEALRETSQGPGKLLLHAERELSPVGVLHSQTDFYATDVLGAMGMKEPFAAGGGYLNEETAIMQALRDGGLQYKTVTPGQLEAGALDVEQYKVLFLPYASCVSDATAVNLRRYVEAGGTLVADGRVGMMTGEGKVRAVRVLDEVFGVKGEAGMAGLQRKSEVGKLGVEETSVTVLEPGLQVTTGKAVAMVGETPVVIHNLFGKGLAIMLNVTLAGIRDERTKEGHQELEGLLLGAVMSAGVDHAADGISADAGPPLCMNTVSWKDGDNRYVAFMRDFRVRGVPAQNVTAMVPERFVYDMRAGKQVGAGKTDTVRFKLDRGYPAVYALLPYRVAGVTATAGKAGADLAVPVAVNVKAQGGKAGYHVVRLEVYAPGAKAAHRQYSQNVGCEGGVGKALIPFAMSDEKGAWRLVWRDVATGVGGETTLRR
ncbi:MAG: alpha-amylase family protein [Armatimonadia bacterium]